MGRRLPARERHPPTPTPISPPHRRRLWVQLRPAPRRDLPLPPEKYSPVKEGSARPCASGRRCPLVVPAQGRGLGDAPLPVGGFGPLRIWRGCAERPAAGREGAAESRLRRDPLPSPPRYTGREMGGHTLRVFRCRGRQRRLRKGEGGKANGAAYPAGQRELLSPEAWGCPEGRGGRECGRTPPTPGAGACLSFNSKEVTQPLGCGKNKRVPFPTAPSPETGRKSPPAPWPARAARAASALPRRRGRGDARPSPLPARSLRPAADLTWAQWGGCTLRPAEGKGGRGGRDRQPRGRRALRPPCPQPLAEPAGRRPQLGTGQPRWLRGALRRYTYPPGVGGGCCPPGPGLPRRGEVMRRRRGRGNANRPRNCPGGIGANREGKGS